MATQTWNQGGGGGGPIGVPRNKVSFYIGGVTIRWSAIFAGMVASLGLWLLLYCGGLALGLSSLSADNPETARVAGVFEGFWGLVSPLIALFIGGFVAARASSASDRFGGALHGLVMWGATTVLGAFLLTNVVGSVLGGAAAALSRTSARDAAHDELAQSGELNGDDGAPAAPDQQAQVQEERPHATRAAIQAVDVTGRLLWWVFGAVALGLLSALFGGYLGGGENDDEPAGPPLSVTPSR